MRERGPPVEAKGGKMVAQLPNSTRDHSEVGPRRSFFSAARLYRLHFRNIQRGVAPTYNFLKEMIMICAKLKHLFLVGLFATALSAADVTGTWTSTFHTQVGDQHYTFEFKVNGSQLTGKAKSDYGESPLEEGKVDPHTISFVEHVTFQDRNIRMAYRGTIVSPNEIKFTREVGDDATEDFVAKRVK